MHPTAPLLRRLLAAIGVDSWGLDLKLGLRMLIRYPGLALIGGFGIAVGVAIAAGTFSVVYGAFLSPSLPLEESDRIVSIETWDSVASRPERRLLRDYHVWRRQLRSVQDIGAFITTTPSLIVPNVQPESIPVASMSASGFRVARVAPLLGRYLEEEDEREGAPWVVVIGESVWRNRFASDPAILGRSLQLGATPHTIVGVMPDGFAFPLNHRFWTPLRLPAAAEPLSGPELMIFGRLAPGATLESAQAEIETIGRRDAADLPQLYAHLQPRALPYANPFMGLHQARDIAGLHWMQGLVSTMLVLVCLNVAILVYSRTVTRQGEIAVRTALGAGRGRILAQLFFETIVLSGAAALTGVAIAEFTLRRAADATVAFANELPFWLTFHLSPQSVLYAGALSVLAAAIVGILPGLQAVRSDAQTGLRALGAGASGMRLGATWTLLIVAQVGVAVALLPSAVSGAWASLQSGFADPGFHVDEFLSARLGMSDAPGAPFADRRAELIRRLETEPNVSGVAFALVNPGEEPTVRVEVQPPSGQPQPEAREARFNHVDSNLFQIFGVPILAGRSFQPTDVPASGESRVVLVNQSLAQEFFAGDALGRRLRYAADEPGPWYEIIGVVADFPASSGPQMYASALKLYHPLAPAHEPPLSLAVHIRNGAPSAFAGRLNELAAAVDPALYLRNILSLDEALRREQWLRRIEAAAIAAVTLAVLLLSSAGIYALMSITVTQRRKEIGIRIALGANQTRIVAGIFSRALGQLGLGAALGAVLAAAFESQSRVMGDNAPVVLPAVALFLMIVGLAAALGPVRRCLRIEPTSALREQ